MSFLNGFDKEAKVLDAADRKKISKKNFVYPETKSFPIEDEAHGKAALARAHFAPDPEKVRAAVYKKYPALKKRHDARQ